VLNQPSTGYLRTYAAGAAVPTTGALDFDDATQAVSTAVPLSSGGAFTILVGAGGPVDLVVDIQGYFSPTTAGGGFTPLGAHLLDTRAAPAAPTSTAKATNCVTKLSAASTSSVRSRRHRDERLPETPTALRSEPRRVARARDEAFPRGSEILADLSAVEEELMDGFDDLLQTAEDPDLGALAVVPFHQRAGSAILRGLG
jgi:hypothetical protein